MTFFMRSSFCTECLFFFFHHFFFLDRIEITNRILTSNWVEKPPEFNGQNQIVLSGNYWKLNSKGGVHSRERKNCHRKITMALIQTVHPNSITLHVCKLKSHSAEVRACLCVRKISYRVKIRLRCKSMVSIVTFYVRTLNSMNRVPELTSAVEQNIYIICVEEYRSYRNGLELIYHDTDNGWTSVSISVNDTIWGVRMLLSYRALKSLNSTERIQPKIICATFNDNPCTPIISFYSPISTSDETGINTYKELYSLVRHIPKHNVLIIGGNMNAQRSKW